MNNNRIKAALIDMDGTIYDSMRGHTAAWHRMMTELGVATSRDEFYLYEGMTGQATIDLLFQRAFGRSASPEEAKELYSRKTRYFRETDEGKKMPDADRMLSILKNNGITCVLVTGSGQRSLIEKVCCDFPGVFEPDKMITSRDVVNGKPAPEPYLKAMELVGVSLDECIVIENAPLGVQSGVAAGVFTIGITTGPILEEKMIEAGADVVYPSMSAFADALPSLLQRLNDCD